MILGRLDCLVNPWFVVNPQVTQAKFEKMREENENNWGHMIEKWENNEKWGWVVN